MSGDFPALLRRPPRRIPAVATALPLLGLGALAGWCGVQQLRTGAWPSLVDQLALLFAGSAWGSGLGFALSGGLAGLGVLLVVVAVAPAQPRNLPLESVRGERVRTCGAFVVGKALARLAVVQARDVDGVQEVTAALSGRTLRMDVVTPLNDLAALRDRLHTRVTGRLAGAGVHPAPKVAIKVRRKAVTG